MRFALLTVLLFGMLFSGLHCKSKMTDSLEEGEPSKALRRSEISKALGLLKKHSVVGKNAKIVLKASGRNLLVDPSERLQVVPSHLSSSHLETHKAAASTNKSSKLTSKTTATKQKNGKSTGKASTKKRASGARASKETVHMKNTLSSRTSEHTFPSSSSSSASSSSSLSSIQRNIMRNAASKSATVIDSLMGSTMLDEITRLVSAIVRNKRTHSLAELSDLITETLDEHFGRHWHTVSVATTVPSDQSNKLKRNSSSQSSSSKTNKDASSQLVNSLQTHVAIDDHRKSSTFYVTYDFGPTLRIYIFK